MLLICSCDLLGLVLRDLLSRVLGALLKRLLQLRADRRAVGRARLLAAYRLDVGQGLLEGGLELELNSLGSIDDRLAYRSALVGWLQERRDALDDDSRSRLESNPLRILDSKNRDTQDLLESAPRLIDALGSDSRERFERVQQGLQDLGIPFRLNPRLVRGLDYYGHTAFEITSDQLGAQATVCGGGRYNSLVEQLGGAATPAIGWALGLERLMLVLEAAAAQDPSGSAASLTASQPPDLFVVTA